MSANAGMGTPTAAFRKVKAGDVRFGAMDANTARERLIELLQKAHAGELSAAHAYRGHARSVRDAVEKAEIRQIELDEWDHRRRVGQLLEHLGSSPDPRRERLMLRVGRTIGFLCRIGGWFIPMYGAGRLERGNIVEYEDAARYALASGHPEFLDDLIDMAEVEWEHERCFREKALTHFLARLFPMWAPPPPKEEIRSRYAVVGQTTMIRGDSPRSASSSPTSSA